MSDRKKKLDVSAIAQCIDTTWGRSSTPKTASQSVKMDMISPDMMRVRYVAVVNFGTEREMIEMKRRYESEAKSIVDAHLKHLRDSYKDLTGSTLTMKASDPVNSLEVVNFNVHNPKRTVWFRSTLLVELS